jgi:hypothetical protein
MPKEQEWKVLFRKGYERLSYVRHATLVYPKPISRTHLQHILTAVAINIVRVDNWFTGTPPAKTRISRFKAIEPKAA